jgi:GNAT superfamily N-acetyltransferase
MATIRPARREDIELLQAIEVEAGRAFLDVGMPDVANDDPLDAATMATYVDDGRAWVAIDPAGAPLGYVLALVIDGQGHVEQVSVHPDAGRQGIGRDLIEQVADWARTHGFDRLTLRTFLEVPWNAPYYRRCGFEVLADDEHGPELEGLAGHEAELGLDVSVRCAMVRPL